MTILKAIGLVIAGLAVGLLVSVVFKSTTLGGVYNQVSNTFRQGLYAGTSNQLTVGSDGALTVGTNGTSLATIKAGSCTIWAGATTIAATSSVQVECQAATNGTITRITGITADSNCRLTMASSTNTTLASLVVGGSSASSTAGSIVARIINLTGTTFTWTATASSSAQWNYLCVDPA